MYQEIKEKLDEALGGIKLVQEVNDRKIKDEEQIKKINDDVCNAMQEVQNLQASQKAIEEQNIKLEKLICNIGNASGNANTDNEKDITAKKEFSSYIRKRTPLSTETVSYIADNFIKKNYPYIEQDGADLVKKEMLVGIDPDGGYWTRPQILDVIASRIFETSPVRQYATVVNTSSNSVIISIDDQEIDAEWVGEDESTSETPTPKTGLLEIFVHKLKVKPKISQDLLDDAVVDVEAFLQNKIAKKFSRKENTTFVSGNGAKKPRGFLDYPAWAVQGAYERGKLEQLISASVGVLDSDDIKKLQNLLLEDYQATARWFMRRETFGIVNRLKDTTTGNYLLDPNSFKVGDTKILLGNEAIFMHDMPLVAANGLSIAYGDLAETYMVIDRLGIRVLRNPYIQDEVVIYPTTKRVGGAVKQFDSFKILKIKA